jgi:uncharacterized protein YbaR (Trm112 family)
MTEETLIPPDLLAIMQCPQCEGELVERQEPPALVCNNDHVYPVRDGIPIMLVDKT